MKYYAKVNTAAPGVGLVTVGEVLTERQAAALGEEKIAELIRDGVLGACGGGDAEAAPGPAGEKGTKPETGAGAKAEPAAKGKEPETGTDAKAKPAAKGKEPEPEMEEEPEEDEELPELGMPEDIVTDEPDTRTDAKATAEGKAETGTAKKGGRRKAK